MRCRVFRPGAWQKIIVLLVAAAASANLQGQSQPTSISFSPGTVEQGECYTIRAGNAANMTLDLRYRSNGGATQTITGWPTLNASGEYSPCTSASTPVGTHVFTGYKNTLATSWLSSSETVVVTAAPPPDFSLSVSPSSGSVTRGSSRTYSVTIGRSGGFTSSVALSVSGLRSGTTGSFSPTSVSSSATTSTLTISTSSSSSLGSDSFTVTGTGGGLTRTDTARVVVDSPGNFSLTVSPSSGSVTRGSSRTYSVAIRRSGGFTSSVSLSVSGLRSGTTGSFSPSSVSSSATTSTLTISASSSSSLGSDSFTVSGTGRGLTRTDTATVVVNAAPQPTSLSFDASSGSAGNDCYTMTVGNGAYMDVELQYRRDAGDLQTMTRTMDAGGQYSYCLAHEDSGQYTFLKIRNALNTAWVELDPAVTYTIRPPQPTSLTITPSTIQAGSGSFRMTVGNGADITLDYRYTLNGGTEREYIGWPSLEPVSEGSSTGQVDVDTGPCTAVGNYVFTSIRNTLNTPWVSVNTPIQVTSSPPPVVTQVSPSSGHKGTSVEVTLTGSNLCDPRLSTSVAGITFSDISYDGVTGTTASFTITIASSTPTGTATITLSANGGSTTFNFQITPPPNTTSLSVSPLTGDVVQGSSRTYTVTLRPAPGFTSSVALSVSGLRSGTTGSFRPTSVSSSVLESTLTISTSSSSSLGSDSFTVSGTGGGLTPTATAEVVVVPPSGPAPDFSLTVSPSSGSVTRGSSRTYSVAIRRSGGFSSSVALSVSGLRSGTTGSFSPSSVSSSATTSTLTISTSSSSSLGSDSFTVTGRSGSLTRTDTATVVVLDPRRQPTSSLSFDASSGYAGNDCYTMTVGNGAYMDVELQYRRDAGDLQTMTRTMDAGGQYSYCLAHEDSGQYTFLKIRNALNTAWVQLNPAETYKIRPPQPTSLTITPSTIQASRGNSFRMTVGNGADVTLDYRYTLNGGPEREYIGWPSLEPVSEGSSTGQVDVDTGPCTAVGNYVFTSIRNTLNTPWVSVNTPIQVTAPPAPAVTAVSPSSGQKGTSVDVTLTGSNLCDPRLTTSVAGITFSDISYDGVTGTTASFTITIESSTSTGTAAITLTANGGSTTFNFQITDTSLSISPLTGEVEQGSSRDYRVTLSPASGFTSSVALSVSGLGTGLMGSFNPTSVSSSALESTLTITAGSTTTLGEDEFTVRGTGGGLTLTDTAIANVVDVPIPPPASLSISPLTGNVAQGSSRDYTVTLSPASGFTSSVLLSVADLETGLTGSFDPTSVSSSVLESTLTVTAASTATLGNDEFTVRGTGGGLTLTATATVTVTVPPPVLVSPDSREVDQGNSTTYTVTVNRDETFTGTVALTVSLPLASGLTGTFSDSSLSGSETTSTLTINASSTATLGSHTFTVTGTSGSLTRSDMADVEVKDPNRRPTSLSFSETEGYAGNDCVTITVGDGANMDVVLKYKRGGTWQGQLTLSLDAGGAYEHCSSHDASGVYTFHAVRNALSSDIDSAWLYLDDPGPVPTYTVHSPQPTSLEIAPSTVRAGSGSYTMTVGNGAGVTLDYRYRLNNAPREESIGAVSLEAVTAGSTTGQATVNTGPCLAVGNYVFTEVRNTLNTPWVSVSTPLEVTAPPAPVVTEVNPSSAAAGDAVDVTLTGSNLCGISLSNSVAGMTFGDVTYDGVTGATVTARIRLASSTPVGTATITLTASGGSTTFNFQVAQEAEPMVTSVLPMDLTNSSDSITLNGSNLNGVSFAVVSQTAFSGEDSERYFPSVSFHSQDPAGTWLKLNVDASDTRIVDFYTIVVWNDTNDDGDQDYGENGDEGLFRVIPDGPIVDYWTPSQTDPGNVYVVSLNGKNLQHAELIAADTNRLRVYNFDNSQDNQLTALVKVLSTAASGNTDLIVRDSANREWRVPITVTSPVKTKTFKAQSQSLSVSNVTDGVEDVSPLYLQQFKARESFTRSLSLVRSVFVGFNYTYNLVNFQWQLPMIYCQSLGEYGDFCLKDLQPGQSIDIKGFVISIYVSADLLIHWRILPPSYPLACLRATAAFEVPGTGGFRESVNFCFGEYVFAGTSGHTASITIDGGGPCVQVEQFPRREGTIGVVPASARVTRLGCCDDADGAVTITASGDTFRSQTFATNFSLTRAPAAEAEQPANCVDTTLTIDDSQNHANIVQADGMDTTTLTVSLSQDPPGTVTRYLEADFGTVPVPSSVMLSSDSATATYTAGTLTQGSTATTAATVKVLRASGDQQALDEVKVLNYDGFNFTDLGISASEMIVSIPSSTTAAALNTTVSQDANVIQSYFEAEVIDGLAHDSFLQDFYISTHTKEGFYDEDGDGIWDRPDEQTNTLGETVYEPPMEQNQAGDSTRNGEFDNCTGEGENLECGEILEASELIARLASCQNAEDANSANNNIFDCSMKRSHRVTPRNMLVTLQKESSIVAKTAYPTTMKLDRAMGCGVTDDPVQNLANRHLYNFYDQIDCSVDTFVERYTEEHYNDDLNRPLAFPFFFKLSDGVKHGEIHPYPVGDRVSFSVANRITYVQYRYTPWIQADNDSGGVHLFFSVWGGRRFRHVDWTTGRPTR